MSIEAIRAAATRPRRTVPIVTDGTLRDQIEALTPDRPVRDRRLTSGVDARLVELRDRAAASTIHVVLEGMSTLDWRRLVDEHPARQVDGKPHPDDTLGVDDSTFRRAAVAACIVGHKPDPAAETVEPLGVDDIAWLVGDGAGVAPFVTDGQMDRLWSAAFEVSRGDDRVPLPSVPSELPESGGE